jgi:nucleoside 2-deoxyribosyltransferase
MPSIRPLLHLRRVYCAGPLFNDAERREMTRIAEALRLHGFQTFVPHSDGMEFSKVQPMLVHWGHSPEAAGRLLHEAIFAMDIYQVAVACGSLVMNLNGRVPDEGAVAELTAAWMLGKPVVIFKEDARSLIAGRDNPLVVGQTGFEAVTRMELLGPTLEAQIALLASDATAEASCPPRLEQAVRLGGRLCERLDRLVVPRPDEEVARIVLELFAGYSSHDAKTGPRLRSRMDGQAAVAGLRPVY